MLRTVGNLPPAVYRRRRMVLLGLVLAAVLLLVLTTRALFGGGDTASGASTRHTPSSPVQRTTTPPTKHAKPATHTPATKHSSHPVTHPSSSSAPTPCVASQLRVAAVIAHADYRVGDTPLVMVQATNTGTAPCVQDFGHNNVELRVYNGESRVWGSNDCGTEAGTIARTLPPHKPIRAQVVWSGTTSQPGCAGTRQQVGAGTYTLYAWLAGRQGAAAPFTLR